MQTPAPHSTQPGPGGTDDDTVLLNTQVIARARRIPPGPAQSYPPRPYPTRRHPPMPAPTPPRNGSGQTAPHVDDDDDDDDAPKFALTATQVVASMSAAVVAAFLGAQLGVAGTVIGAAIASVISVVGSAVIGHSLLVTRRKVVQTVQHVRTPGSPADNQETVLITAVTRSELERTARLHPTSEGPVTAPRRAQGIAAEPKGRGGWWPRPGRMRWVLVGLATSVLVFAGALGAVTVVEAVKGAPISGGSQGGFSVLGGNSGAGRTSTKDSTTDTPTTTAESTATVTETTTAPAASTSSSTSTTAPTTGSSTPASSSNAPSRSTSSSATTASSPTPAAQTPTVTATG